MYSYIMKKDTSNKHVGILALTCRMMLAVDQSLLSTAVGFFGDKLNKNI